MFIYFDRNHERDGHTDGRTDRQTDRHRWRHRPHLHSIARQKWSLAAKHRRMTITAYPQIATARNFWGGGKCFRLPRLVHLSKTGRKQVIIPTVGIPTELSSAIHPGLRCRKMSVCPSVCPSHVDILSKRLNISSYFFPQSVAAPF